MLDYIFRRCRYQRTAISRLATASPGQSTIRQHYHMRQSGNAWLRL